MNTTPSPHDPALDPQAAVPPLDEALTQSTPSLGQRLQSARLAKGWTLEYCSEALHLPRSVLRKLEADEHLGIDYAIYLRSYISNYGRLLGWSGPTIEASLPQLKTSQPELVSTGGIPRSRHLLERYARAATYVVLTAVIVVPVAWLGVTGTLDHNISHLAPLDASPVASAAVSAAPPAVSTPAQSTPLTASAQPPVDLHAPSVVAAVPPAVASSAPAPVQPPAQPLMASMMPSLDEHPLAPSAAAVVGQGAHSLSLSLAQASWVEVTTADGRRLEYGLLPAGSHKSFRSDQDLQIRIGNASGASVSLDGQPLALEAYRHANVARFKVAVQGAAASATAF